MFSYDGCSGGDVAGEGQNLVHLVCHMLNTRPLPLSGATIRFVSFIRMAAFLNEENDCLSFPGLSSCLNRYKRCVTKSYILI